MRSFELGPLSEDMAEVFKFNEDKSRGERGRLYQMLEKGENEKNEENGEMEKRRRKLQIASTCRQQPRVRRAYKKEKP